MFTVNQLILNPEDLMLEGEGQVYQPPPVIVEEFTPSYRMQKRKSRAVISAYSRNLMIQSRRSLKRSQHYSSAHFQDNSPLRR